MVASKKQESRTVNAVEFPAWTLLPFAISVVLFGLPHGALDHLLAARLFCRARPTPIGWITIVAGYLLAVGLGWLVWLINPTLGFVAFILLTWYHWGQGELEATRRWRSSWLGNKWHRISYLAWRGAQPMLLPLVFQSAVYASVAEACLLFFAKPNSALADAIAAVPPVALVTCLILGGLEKILAPRATRWSVDKISLEGALALLFLFVHPLFAVGLYFLCWHAPHHLNRLRHSLGEKTILSWSRLQWLAMPLTLLTCVALLTLHASVAHLPLNAASWLALYLVALSCLTWPHAILVTMQDKKEKIWDASDGVPLTLLR